MTVQYPYIRGACSMKSSRAHNLLNHAKCAHTLMIPERLFMLQQCFLHRASIGSRTIKENYCNRNLMEEEG